MALTQVGIVGQGGTQAGLPATAGVPAALLKVGHGAQVHRAGCKQVPCKHAAGLHCIGGWRQEEWGKGQGSGLPGSPGPALPHSPQLRGLCTWLGVCV